MSETYGVEILCGWLSLASDVTGRICLMLLWVPLAPATKKPRQAVIRAGLLTAVVSDACGC
jgi:hypothetical protein